MPFACGSRRQDGPGELAHPATIVLENDAQGQPLVSRIAGHEAPPRISISHCGKAAAATAGDQPTGVDVAPASSSPLELWDQFTTAAEREIFAELLRGEPDEFWATRLWCAKEAVGKVLGTGLGGRPRDFEAAAAQADGTIQICHRPTGEVFTVSTSRDEAVLLAITARDPQTRFEPPRPDVVLGFAPE